MGSWLDIKEEGSVSGLDIGKHMPSYGSYESKSYLSHTVKAGSFPKLFPKRQKGGELVEKKKN